jgi:hypothetical protein
MTALPLTDSRLYFSEIAVSSADLNVSTSTANAKTKLWGLRWWMMGLLMGGSIVNDLTRSTSQWVDEKPLAVGTRCMAIV